MSHLNKIGLSIIFLALMFAGTNHVHGQTYTEVVNKFNEAQEVLRAKNLPQALELFREAAQMSRAVGSEADELRSRAERQIPNIQFAIGKEQFSTRKFDEAIETFKAARNSAVEYNESNIKSQVDRALPVVFLQYGNIEFRNENIDKAERLYNSAIEENQNYGRAYYQLGLVERRRNNVDEAIAYYDQAIQIARSTSDREVENLAEGAARDYLTYLGASSLEDERVRQAITYLERSLEYDMEHADTYYRLAEAYNNSAMWDEAIRAAQQALRYERGGQVAKAKIHFELGISYKNQNNKGQACTSFKNAAYGNFRAAAEHEIEHELKCN